MEPSTQEILARVERLEHLQLLGSGGGSLVEGESTVVWRPGVVSAGNVFATWAEVVAAVSKLNGAITIGLDTDFGAANIPVGNYDLRPAGISGPVTIVNASKNSAFPAPFFTILAGATTIHGLSGLDDVQVVNNSTVPVITSTTDQGAFTLSKRGTINQTSNAPFLSVTAGRILFLMTDFASVVPLGGQGAVAVAAPGFLDMSIQDTAFFGAQQLVALAAVVGIALAFNATFGSQSVTGATVIPAKSCQRGTASIDGVSGKSANITAIINGAQTTIQCTQRQAVGDATTVRYAALIGDRVNGNLGTFKIAALTAAGGGTVNATDASSVDWEVVN
jgi:hypothetical protein